MKLNWLKNCVSWLRNRVKLSLARRSVTANPHEPLSLVPLEEIEDMIKKELDEKEKRSQSTRSYDGLERRKHMSMSAVSHKTGNPHVADLSSHHEALPVVITCVTVDDTSDPNLKITHYPPSNVLH